MPSLEEREALYGPVLRAAFVAQGVPGSWGMAFARHESAFLPDASNHSSGDQARGGSYGLCQMSMLTAQGMGYTGDARGLLDPAINAGLAARLVAKLCDTFAGSLGDVAAAYNSGKSYAHAPQGTRMHYVPAIIRYQALYAHFDTDPPATV